ncbi:MAG: glycosyltransferase [Akkermansiaceae bacterium]|mgnify:FL=1|jgi:rSAM/selenodomain-associated transferase 1|tara:strand:- start:18128 stop:18877 length:750 start_codon:yes stop_codon:yes gene_type:complete
MRLLLVFLKEPIPGKVKTRLAQDVGDEDASRYYKALVEVLLKQLQGLQDCRIRFCYAPDDAEDAIRFWVLPEMRATSSSTEGLYLAPHSLTVSEPTQEVDFRPQGSGDLGDRLDSAFKVAFEDNYSEVAVIGTDCPDCGARWINAAFSRLSSDKGHDVVIGPSSDGGYYLLALKSPASKLFLNIPWSENDVFEKTAEAAMSAGLTLESLPKLSDVDHLSDWDRVIASPLGAALKKALGEPLEDTLSDLS